jgi:hypothetical protein
MMKPDAINASGFFVFDGTLRPVHVFASAAKQSSSSFSMQWIASLRSQ